MKLELTNSQRGETRRQFIKKAVGSAVVFTGLHHVSTIAGAASEQAQTQLPWYRRAYRWGQTNITEPDPIQYDIAWWRQHWRRTRVQGVIINAGGIVAYYPSKYSLHYRAAFLGTRDLYGDLVRAAREEGLAVLARMDSNRTAEPFYRAHPDWFALDASGQPYRAGDLYVTCINSPYYDEFLANILREIIERTHPDGITDNSWSGLGRNSICYCEPCSRRFRDKTGQAIPKSKNWNDSVYREWIQWNYARRLEVWDFNNRITKETGGADCLWIGMNSGSVPNQSSSFRDLKEICRRAEIIMLDHQARNDPGGFQENGQAGKLIHGLLGWDKLIPESMAMYQAGRPTFRKTSKPEAEARMWVLEGFAGTIQPWWHHVGADQEDRRQFRTIESINRWHEANERFLVNRQPVASVGVVWSQQNTDFYGRDHAEELVELPLRGMMQALTRGRIPYLPVHADYIGREAAKIACLILPNFAVMTASQAQSVRDFVQRGGGLIATGETSLCNQWGEPQSDFALGDLFKAHRKDGQERANEATRLRRATETLHTYLRITPEWRGRVYGPKMEGQPRAAGERHLVLRGFDDTDILPFGGSLSDLEVAEEALVPLTFIPAFPIYPPETAWMRQARTDIPALILNDAQRGGRVAFLAADIDRRFSRDNLPDHGDLLANLVRWVARDNIPLQVRGRGLIDCHVYRQPGQLIVHLVNLTNAGTWRAPLHELLPVGPFQVDVRLPDDVRGRRARSLVADAKKHLLIKNRWATIEVKSIVDHEVLVIE